MRIHDTAIFPRIRFLTFLGKILRAFHYNHSHFLNFALNPKDVFGVVADDGIF